MPEDSPKYNSRFEAQAKGFAVGDGNIIYNYYGYREEVVSAAPVDSTDDDLPCPYRGLYHFSPNDAEFFFGRDVFVENLFQATQTRNFIPVLGASGSGKSSVVLAGLIPKLEQEEKGHWKFTHFRPGSDPFHALALALVPLYTPDLDETEQIAQTRKLAGYLNDKTIPLSDVFAKIKQNHFNHRILLIADQFEEIYTQCFDQKVRRRFLDCLLASFQSSNSSSSSSTVLVTTMRADFLANALSYRPFADRLQNADIKLGAMSRKELKEVIEKPAEKLGVTFEAGLVERILNDVEDEPGNLPLLEFALTELWKKRRGKQLTHKAYEAIGQVKGALADYADDKYEKLTSEEQEQARRIFIQLVRPGEGTEDTRRRANRSELGEENWSLITRKEGLADSRLVVTNRNDSERETVEVVHEALIQKWSKLRQWMKTDRKFRAWQEQLRTDMRQWENTRRDEGALLRGVPLAEAEDWQQKRSPEVSKDEKVFINASISLRDKEKNERDSLRRRIITGLTLGLLGALGLAGLAGLQWRRAERQLKIVRAREILALSELQSNVNAECSLALALEAYNVASKISDLAMLSYDSNLRQALSKTRVDKTFDGFSDGFTSVEWNPTNNTFASADSGQKIVEDGKDITAIERGTEIWDARTGKKLLNSITSRAETLAWSTDGKLLATSTGGTIEIWNIETNKKIANLTGHKNLVTKIDWSPDDKFIVTLSQDGSVRIWNIKSGENTILDNNNQSFAIAWNPNGNLLATTTTGQTIKLWDSITGKNIGSIKTEHTSLITSIDWSPGGTWMVSGSEDGTISLLDIKNLKSVAVLEGHHNQVLDVAWSPDGNFIASASWDSTIILWETRTGKNIATFTGHTANVVDISWSPDSKQLVSSSRDRTVRVWNIFTNTSNKESIWQKTPGWVWDVSWSPDGKFLASASDDRKIRIWDVEKKNLRYLDGHKDQVTRLAWSPDGKFLATASFDETVRIWNINTGKQIHNFDGHKAPTFALAWSPDGKFLASSSVSRGSAIEDFTVKVWDVETGENIGTVDGVSSTSLAWSPDGKILASSSSEIPLPPLAETLQSLLAKMNGIEGYSVLLWNVDNINTNKVELEIDKTLSGHRTKTGIWGLSFSPNGEFIASASDDGTVKIWDVQTEKAIKTFSDHSLDVKGVAWSPDGKQLATASLDKTIRIWDAKTGENITILTGHTSGVRSVAWSSDGKKLASAAEDGTVRIWDTDINNILSSAQEQISNGLTSKERKTCSNSTLEEEARNVAK